jgi:hypothetical protein
VLRNRLEEPALSCVRELKIRRGAARTADLNMMAGCIKESVSVKRALEQRKDEVWTLKLRDSVFCQHHIFFSG